MGGSTTLKSEMTSLKFLRRFFPVVAFLGGFAWDALTIGQRVRAVDLWTLGAYLAAACGLAFWLALRAARAASGNRVTYCLGLHAKMPPIEDQLPLLRALWPGPLVCRWNLHRRHGAFGYEAAKAQYEPFDQLIDPDDETRTHLARVIAGTCGAGELAYVTINNKAEGSAPLSVAALAEAVTNDAPGQGDS